MLKKKMITGVSTLVLGISVVGAAYALPMTNAPMQSENTKAPKATVTMQQVNDTVDTDKTVNEMKQNTDGQMAGVSGNSMQDTMSKTMPTGQAMNQQQMNSQMNQNSQQMAKYHEQMQQNHQQMNEYHQSNHQAMSQNHRNMSGAAMNGQMGSGHMGN